MALAHGFVPGYAKYDPDSTQDILVQVHEAQRLTVFVCDPAKNPIPCVRVFASQASVSCYPCADDLPGANQRYAVHQAVSDTNGFARFESLEDAAYRLRVDPVHGVPLQGARPVRPSEEPRMIILGQVYVAAVAVEGDEVMTHEFTYEPAEFVGESVEPALAAAHKELQQKFPDTIHIVTLPSAKLQEKGSTPIEASVFLRHGGWRDLTGLRLRPVNQVTDATTFRFVETGLDLTGTLVLRLERLDGALFDIDHVCLRQMQSKRLINIPLRNGEPMRVPAGEYTLFTLHPMVTQELRNERFSVKREKTTHHTIRMKTEFVAARIRVEEPSGALGNSALVRILDEGGRVRANRVAHGAAEIQMWLPTAGTYKVAATLDGFVNTYKRVDLSTLKDRPEITVKVTGEK